ncbi:transposase [Nitrosomonas sp.]|uniref:transposase n=1 Tax=Nitrosomonas sp. TaxID=42353 RepID=UPI00262A4F13|nr:transposase [Nitrosomonas sp.]
MSKKRTQYSSEFKAKVALAAIRRDETIPQLAARYGIHLTQINSWTGPLILPMCRWRKALAIWLPSWTGIPVKC